MCPVDYYKNHPNLYKKQTKITLLQTFALLEDEGEIKMNLTICNEKNRTTITVDFKESTVNELLTYLNINSETVLVVRNNEVLTEDEVLNDKDTLEILSVVSGG